MDFRVITLIFIGSYVIRASILRSKDENDSIKKAAEDKPVVTELKERQKDPESSADETKGLQGLKMRSKDSKAFLNRQDDPRPIEEDAWGYAQMGRGHQKLARLDDPQPGRRKGRRYGRRYGSRYGGRYGEHHYPEHYYPYNRRYGVSYNEEGSYHEEKKVVKLDDPQPVKEQGKNNKGRLMLSSKDSKAFLKRQDDPKTRNEEKDEGYYTDVSGRHGGVVRIDDPRPRRWWRR